MRVLVMRNRDDFRAQRMPRLHIVTDSFEEELNSSRTRTNDRAPTTPAIFALSLRMEIFI